MSSNFKQPFDKAITSIDYEYAETVDELLTILDKYKGLPIEPVKVHVYVHVDTREPKFVLVERRSPIRYLWELCCSG